MIYSCFNPAAGKYDYFQDDLQIPINADLPVPKMPSVAGKVGVPAIDAGRPLPANAKSVGSGWHARGLVVRCGRGGLGGTAMDPDTGVWLVLLGGMVLGVVLSKMMDRA